MTTDETGDKLVARRDDGDSAEVAGLEPCGIEISAHGDREVQQAGQSVPDHGDLSSIDPIDQSAGDRPEQQIGQQPNDQHTGDGSALSKPGFP